MIAPRPMFYLLKCETQSPPNFPKPSCVNQQNAGLFNYLSSKLMEKGIISTVTPARTTCLGRCSLGPVLLVEPGHFMYVGMTEEKIDKVIDEHIIGGNPVTEYLIEDELWSEPVSIADAQKMAGI